MTEAEWLNFTEAYQPLIYIRELASLRKLRLLSAPYVHWLESCPGYEDAKPCSDIIERMADNPIPYQNLSDSLYARPGNWSLAGTLGPSDQVGQAVNKLVAFGEFDFRQQRLDVSLLHLQMRTLLHEVFGNPFRPVTLDPNWLTSDVVAMARGMYETRDFSAMPILADALQDAGCEHAGILDHCRDPNGIHVRGCWVVDLVLGKS